MEQEPKISPKELKPISLQESCVIGSVLFKDYSVIGSEGNIRGNEAIESLYKIARKGYKAAFLITEGTDNRFIDDLKNKLKPLGDKAENVVWKIEKEQGYSGMRRRCIEFARSKYPESRAFIMQEIEKDLSDNYGKFINVLSDNKILVMMDRGINIPFGETPLESISYLGANLPNGQFWGERYQNLKMARQENMAGLTKKEHYWDRLNGTRVIRNEKVQIGNVKINPSDLILLKYKYSDGYDEKDRTNKIDTYSASVYNMIPILEGLGIEDKIAELPVKYLYPNVQKKQEETDPKFREKRLKQKIDLPAINYDIVANIKKWKNEGNWPKVLVDALDGDRTLEIEHLNVDGYSLAS